MPVSYRPPAARLGADFSRPRPAPAMNEQPPIRVVGARVHNLKNVSVEIPAGTLTVLSGVSGSGKSSLAFDTIHAEGQRRFLATASPKARAAIAKLDRPDVNAVEHLPPVIAVGQSDPTAGPRTTLATLVGLHDLFRLLWAGAGVPHDPDSGDRLERHTVRQIVDRIFALPERTKLMVLAPAGEATGDAADREIYEAALKEGFVRCEVGDESFETAELAAGEATPAGPVHVVIDRAIVKPGAEDRVRESVDLAVARTGGDVALRIADAEVPGGWRTEHFRTRLIDPTTGGERRPLTPQSFSFHSPRGACPACGGVGLADSEATTARHRASAPCPACDGERLNRESRAVRVDGLSIGEAGRLSVEEAAERFATIAERVEQGEATLSAGGAGVAERLLPDVRALLDGLRRVGLGYLGLDRRAGTLSGGEYRRARLAGALGERVSGACFVLDEPTVGLHPADADRLWNVLVELRDAGNTTVLVEHDPDLIRRADRLIDLGPGAGADG
ncbi:ABC-ATPase UvrA, partial [Alienimonas sp. DA493]